MSNLKQKFADKALPLRDELKALIKANGDKVVSEVTLAHVYSGMKGIKSMITDTSALDPQEGIRFRGYTIPELQDLLPRAEGGSEPLPEGLFYLMLTGEIPSKDDVTAISNDWSERAKGMPEHVYKVLDSFPADTHPMVQFSAGILAMGTDSVFQEKYAEGINKKEYWDPMFEDSMNLIARIPRLAAYIYRRTFHGGNHIAADDNLDWAANFAHMLGFDNMQMLMRLYLTIHADHEGGNVSAHLTHLTGSALSDAYQSLSSAMNGLAGPLHGLANQEVIKWIMELREWTGKEIPNGEEILKFAQHTIDNGRVIPGYGHAVLRKTDPRFSAQQTFAEKHLADAPLVQVVWNIYGVMPKFIEALGKVANPWPNVDAHSGALLVHYGMKEYSYYTVLFGVSRALGVLASLCYSRALGLGIERPKSVTTGWIKEFLGKKEAVN